VCAQYNDGGVLLLLLMLMLLQAHGIAESQAVTAAITGCRSDGELLLLIKQHISRMDLINVSAAIFKLSKLQVRESYAWAVCVQRFLQLPHIPTRNLSNVIYALCKAPPLIRQQHTPELQQQLVPTFMSQHANANAQDTSNVLYGIAASGQQLPQEAGQQLLAAFVSQRVLVWAKPQEVSNTLWAAAKLGQQVPSGHLQQLLDAFVGKLQQAKPQAVSNTLWAAAKLGQQVPAGQFQQLLDAFVGQLQQAKPQEVSSTLWAVATMGQQVPAGQLQQLLDDFVSKLQKAKPQEVFNTLWAVATMGQQVPTGQLQQLLDALVGKLQQIKPQEVSNTLWAVATMGQQVPAGQLQQLLDAFVGKLQQAKPQELSNMLLACAKLDFYPKQLLAAPGLAGLLQADTPQHLAIAAWSCGQLGHRDAQLMAALLAEVLQRLAAAETRSSRSVNSQNLCNLCWAVAVLDLQQHAQQVLQLAQACSSMWSSTEAEGQRQLWQVHTWLLDFQLAGGQGLQDSLTQQQLQQCRAAWDEQLQQSAKQRHTDFQRSVFAAVQGLPIAWQQQPQMEQLSVGRDGVTPDGALLIDIAGRTANGVLVAVEADGPWHFRQPDGGLTGTTQYRNRALAVRGYRLVSVPYQEWARLRGDQQRQQQYLMGLFKEAGVC
jgi:hypothetical protein